MSATDITGRLLRWHVLREGCTPASTDLFAELAREASVACVPDTPDTWIISRHDLVTRFSSHSDFTAISRPKLPNSIQKKNPDFVEFFPGLLTFQAPTHHQRLYSVLSSGFIARSLERLRNRTAALIEVLFAQLRADRGGEFVSKDTIPLPSLVTAALLDLPEAHWPMVSGWARGMLAQLGAALFGISTAADPISVEQFRQLRSYVGDLVRRRENSSGALANSILCLLNWPEEWQRVVDDLDRSAKAFEKSIGRTSATVGVRTACEDVEFGGRDIHKGSMVMLVYSAVNLEPRRFKDPLEYRWDRAQSASMTFGHGRHFCLGAGLAWLQGELVPRKLVETGVTLGRPLDALVWRNDPVFNTPAELWLRFDSLLAVAGTGLPRGTS